MKFGDRTKASLRVVTVLFCTWTAMSIVFTMIPLESSSRKKLAPVLNRWRSLTGLEQHWNMFATVPHHREYQVVVEIEPRNGGGMGEPS